MAIGPQLVVSIIAAVFSVTLTGLFGAFAWYFHKYVLGEIERNSEFRRYVGGEAGIESDGGEIDSLRSLSGEMNKQHSELSHRMDYLTAYVRNMGDALDRQGIHFEEPDRSEPLKWRGENDD